MPGVRGFKRAHPSRAGDEGTTMGEHDDWADGPRADGVRAGGPWAGRPREDGLQVDGVRADGP